MIEASLEDRRWYFSTIKTNELLLWFLAENLVDVPFVHANQGKAAAARGYRMF